MDEKIRVCGSIGRVIVFGRDPAGLRCMADEFRSWIGGFDELQGSQMLSCRDAVLKEIGDCLCSEDMLTRLYYWGFVMVCRKGCTWGGVLCQPGPFTNEEIAAGDAMLRHTLDHLVAIIEVKADVPEYMGMLQQLIFSATYNTFHLERIAECDKGVV